MAWILTAGRSRDGARSLVVPIKVWLVVGEGGGGPGARGLALGTGFRRGRRGARRGRREAISGGTAPETPHARGLGGPVSQEVRGRSMAATAGDQPSGLP